MVDELLISVLGLVITVVGMLGTALYWLGGKFREIDTRFQQIDERFKQIDERFREIERKLASFADSVKSATVAMNSMVIEFLGVKGLVSPGEASFLVNEVNRLSQSIRLNPITKEELEFIKSVFSRGDIDKISVEELERVAEIAKRWWWEDGSEIAYKMFLYTWMLRAYKLYGKKEGGVSRQS
ncbi:hypothetical protein JCM16161A_00070 [Vulcanisaeta sp. JCM 16161]|uniref:hypothetical protein n=1 Tax=Vulcanisaeta sp. JCM 16161 TaxID=1295372 RepID=UPI000A725A2C|nr:hypothetical protein [Vulcanisaeta sp. JCM 16161]